MKKLQIMGMATVLLLLIVCSTSWAQKGKDVELTSKAEKEVTTVTAEGKKEVKYTSVAKTLPGDVVRFTNHYKNKGNAAADNVAITNPVPEHMTYVEGSAFGEGAVITFSADKGKSFDLPAKLVKTEKGRKRPARPDEYTHIRWSFKEKLPAGKEGDAGFKARIK